VRDPHKVPTRTRIVPTHSPNANGPFTRRRNSKTGAAQGRRIQHLRIRALHQETHFLAEVFRLAAKLGLRGVVSHSDPVPRQRADGTVIMPGHVGHIYAAKGAEYVGRAWPRTLHVLPDGRVFSGKAQQKIRDQDRGHRYAEDELIRWGARPMRAGERPDAWLAAALEQAGARRVRTRGVHRYAFTLGDRRERARVVIGQAPVRPYPKTPDRAPSLQLGLFPPGPGAAAGTPAADAGSGR
jgi:hypothetical protein